VSQGDSVENSWLQQITILYNVVRNNKQPDIFYNQVVQILTMDTTINIANLQIIDSLYKNPKGFAVDLNTAYSGILPGDSVQKSSFAQAAVWLIFTYRWTFDTRNSQDGKKKKGVTGFVELTGIIPRFTYNYHNSDYTKYVDSFNYLDFGAGIAATINNFSAGFEGIIRGDINGSHTFAKYTWHLTASVDYKVQSMLDVKLAFGRNFNGSVASFDGAAAGALYCVAGLGFNISGISPSSSSSN
jgi:hypothetical protein